MSLLAFRQRGARSGIWRCGRPTSPHGTTVNLEGVAFTAPAPLIANTTITPFTVGSPDDGATGLTHFPEETLTNVTPSRTPTADVPGLTQAILTNPNKLLQDAIAGQDIIGTTVLIIASDPTLMPPPGGPVPAHATAGGGIANIGFLSGGVSRDLTRMSWRLRQFFGSKP